MIKSVYSAFLLMIAAGAAGCSGVANGPDEALTVAEQHPISVDSQTVTMTIDAGEAAELSALDEARIRAFASAYLQNGHGDLSVTAPSGGGSDEEGEAAAGAVRQALYDSGVPWSSMTPAAYRLSEGSDRDVILSYTRYIATPSACGVWEGLRENDYRNLRTPNFGCATQNNLAAMIGDPHDLIAPAEMTDPDAALRIRGVERFRAGESTASETDGELEAEVSN